jgi:hypothetical protein
MSDVARLQAYLRHTATRQYEALYVLPFTLFFHPHDPFPAFSYAIPNGPVGRPQNSKFATQAVVPSFARVVAALIRHTVYCQLVAQFQGPGHTSGLLMPAGDSGSHPGPVNAG